jgi:NAD(P)H-hydrate repair Nnr-like enzyme with NAD(P)H-hydrate dehydratase domain
MNSYRSAILNFSQNNSMPLTKLLMEFIPDLNNPNLRKGDCGRIGIIGGSEEYTGAPYFAGAAAFRTVRFLLTFSLFRVLILFIYSVYLKQLLSSNRIHQN